MTKRQEERIEEIRRCVPSQLFYGDNYEIKEWKIEDMGHCISLYIVTGLKNDEGTLASILCRDIVHLFIGKRGGIKYFDGKKIQEMWQGITLWRARRSN